jgi:hypothetical protein
MTKGLPKNYNFSTFVLQSKEDQANKKFEYITNPNEGIGIIEHTYQKPPSTINITYATESLYDNFISKTKASVKSFNYTQPDQLRTNNSVILDLSDESTVLEKLDKYYDIKDGYII